MQQTIARATASVLALLAAPMASAQGVPPVLQVDFTGATVPLSPALTAMIALGIGAVAWLALRRSRSGGRLVSWLGLALVAGALAPLAQDAAWIGRAQAAFPEAQLALVSHPSSLSGYFVGYVRVTNVGAAPATLTLIDYSPNGWNSYVSVPETDCAVGTSLQPGAFCTITIRTTG